MRNLTWAICLLPFLFLGACKKDSSTPAPNNSNNNNNNNNTSPYYFKFSFNSANFNFNANDPQYMTYGPNIIGGFQEVTPYLLPDVGLELDWPSGDTVRENDVLGLVGKTLHFNDTAIHPELTYDESAAVPIWYSEDTANANFYVKITAVSFLKKDTTLGYPLRTYVITGTCAAVMSQSDSVEALSNGEFNFIISRLDL